MNSARLMPRSKRGKAGGDSGTGQGAHDLADGGSRVWLQRQQDFRTLLTMGFVGNLIVRSLLWLLLHWCYA
jgi:hypothetical protein